VFSRYFDSQRFHSLKCLTFNPFLMCNHNSIQQIYSKHGWAGLKASESFAEISSLDTPPFARFDAFFEGTDPDDRQYLLLEASSGGHFSDEERPDKRCEVTEPEDNDSDEDSDSDSQVHSFFFSIYLTLAFFNIKWAQTQNC